MGEVLGIEPKPKASAPRPVDVCAAFAWRLACQGANGENIAAGRSGAANVLDQWKNSDGH